MAEPIEMPFGVWTLACPMKDVLDANWPHQVNTIKLSMCGGDAAFLSNNFDRLFLFHIL